MTVLATVTRPRTGLIKCVTQARAGSSFFQSRFFYVTLLLAEETSEYLPLVQHLMLRYHISSYTSTYLQLIFNAVYLESTRFIVNLKFNVTQMLH